MTTRATVASDNSPHDFNRKSLYNQSGKIALHFKPVVVILLVPPKMVVFLWEVKPGLFPPQKCRFVVDI